MYKWIKRNCVNTLDVTRWRHCNAPHPLCNSKEIWAFVSDFGFVTSVDLVLKNSQAPRGLVYVLGVTCSWGFSVSPSRPYFIFQRTPPFVIYAISPLPTLKKTMFFKGPWSLVLNSTGPLVFYDPWVRVFVLNINFFFIFYSSKFKFLSVA